MIRRTGREGEAALVASPQPAAAAAWPVLDEVAYIGLAGEVVRLIDPSTEADRVAVLVNFLLAFGNAAGRSPHIKVGQARHGANEFALLVGDTAKARKGSSRDGVRSLMARAAPEWMERQVSGLSSGEGLIWAVRDAVTRDEPLREKGRPTGEAAQVQVDAGVADKRLFVEEEEFSNVLKQIERQGNTLSEVARAAWDARERLQVLTKQNAAVATAAHISVIGHITAAEYRRRLTATEQANGLANRFLLFCVTRSKAQAFLPEIAPLELDRLGRAIRFALTTAERTGQVGFSAAARVFWEERYPAISAPLPGLIGAMTARAEAHALRLALIYALLANAPEIEVAHLEAACALIAYVQASVRYVFGDASGDPLEDRIIAVLRDHGPVPRAALSRAISDRYSGADLDRVLARLIGNGKLLSEQTPTPGRPFTTYRLAGP